MRCYACHQLNSATARFCVECGAALAPAPPQPVTADQAYAPAPYTAMPRVPATAEAPYAPAPAPYGMAPAGPNGLAVPYAAVPAAQGGSYAQLGYGAPQTAGAPPAMVNNVTVTHAQIAPPAPRPPAPATATARNVSGLGVILRAFFFLGSGAVAGALWASLRPYDASYSVNLILAILATLIVLVADIVILDRMGRG